MAQHTAPTDTSPRPTTLAGLAATSVGLSILGVIAAFVALLVAVGGDDDAGSTVLTGSGSTVEVDVSMGEFFVDPPSVEVDPGAELVLNVTNDGTMAHDLKLDGEVGTEMLDPGESETVTLGPITDSSVAWCTVPGHRDAGMEMQISVTGGGSAGAPDGGDSTTASAIDFAATPGDDWKPFDPRLAPAPGGTEHEIAISASETVLEIAPGLEQEMWTFNGTVPGPILRGKVGDIFTVTLTNDGEVGHSIDFHASKVAWNDEMRTIQPGESLVYQFEAKHSGIFMFHCGTPPTIHHIGNGMYGAVIIDPPGLPPVDHEFVFLQSELYVGEDGAPGSLQAMADEDWDAVVFNGYVNQYLHAPIRVEPGERVRAWVLDEGPSENSSFHIVGTIFDTMYKEGAYTLRPGPEQGGAQALDLQPAQGGFVEFTFDEPGLYPIVTHKFANVGKGALGLFQAGEVDTEGGGAH